MMKEIRLKNFLSFKDVNIDLSARKDEVLRYAMIYGENGSGKTNIIDSVAFLREEMDTLASMNERMPEFSDIDDDEISKEINNHISSILSTIHKATANRDPKERRKIYRSKSVDNNTRVEYNFITNGNRTNYVLEFDRNGRLVYEQMKHRINKGQGTFFTISWDGENTDVSINKDLINDRGYRKDLMENIKRYWGNHSLLAIINADRKRMLPEYIGSSIRKELLDVMDYIDSIVIVDNEAQEGLGPIGTTFSGKIESEKADELDSMESILNKFFTRLYSHTVRVEVKRKDKGDFIQYKVVFHRKINGQVVEIDADDESAGTKHLIGLIYPILSAVTGSTVFVDELDNGIHDNLLSNLVEQIIPHITGQLVCTTHESMLLDIISPSNAFVIQVDGNGNKNITSISSIEKIQKNNSVQKRFLGGRYMGVPIMTELILDDIVEDFHKESVWRNLR